LTVAERAFSRKCGKCRQRTVELATVPYTTQIDHDGRKYTVTIPDLVIPRCGNCGTIVLDEEANRRISAAFRSQAGLLPPEQIRRHRTALGLTQQALADLLGVAVATLSRWETGAQIQQRSLDRFLRAVFVIPELRRALVDGSLDVPEIGDDQLVNGASPPSDSPNGLQPSPLGTADFGIN
jgi:putative zinc finger/helix-turn-helix YgiT family protein